MTILTIFFLTLSLIHLFKGELCERIFLSAGNTIINIYKENEGISNKDAKFHEPTFQVFFAISIIVIDIIVELFYYINGLHYDIFKYPTLFMIIITVITFVYSIVSSKSNDKYDLNKIEDRIKYDMQIDKYIKINVRKFAFRILDIAYYGYMFYIFFIR